MTRNRRLVASAAVLLALSLAIPTASATAVAAGPDRASVSLRTQLQLPAPSGPFTVGRKDLHLVDKSRTDPWEPAAGARELMVSVHYPASGQGGGAPAPYMGKEEARLMLEGMRFADRLPPELLAGARANSRTHARPAGGKYPLVILSPGFTLHRATLTLLAEELASRGYVVALLDHAYESYGTRFPGGRTLTCSACVDGATDRAPAVRAADVSFVIDQLLGGAGGFARNIDRGRIGTAGHSMGGNSAVPAMAGDSRIRAGANLDGAFSGPGPVGAGLRGRPFLLLGTDATHRPEGKGKWLEAWGRMDGWKRWLTVAGSGHFSFSDVPVLGGQVGAEDPAATLPGKRSGELTRAYVGAFFDLHLKGKQSPLLDGPTSANPEVSFHNP